MNQMMNNYRYEIIIYWSKEDEAYVTEVPELAGCMADGKTYIEALLNTETIIGEWIETAKELNKSIPEPIGRLRYA
jgi:predicted RNase H-like HicB family nuclease